MTSISIARGQVRPVTSEAAAQAVARATARLLESLSLIREALNRSSDRTREVLARRRDAQRVLRMARRFETTQPGFASDLRCAAYRAMDEA